MGSQKGIISPTCSKRLRVQGFEGYSDAELASFRFGIRLAYGLCALIVLTGLILGSEILLIVAAIIALMGTMPPYHPFDYLYNYGIRHLLGKPKLPPRPNQGRFACGIAATWLAVMLYLTYIHQPVAVYILGATLLFIASLVIFLDICIPSMIYNFMFRRNA